jgi:hypothetical protein
LTDGLAFEPDFPLPERTTPFPLDALADIFSVAYYTNSLAYMIALATWECDYDSIFLCGIRFDDKSLWDLRRQAADWLDALRLDNVKHTLRGKFEPGFDKYVKKVVDGLRGLGSGDEAWAVPCIEYWIGRAQQAGISVTWPEDSGLFISKWATPECDCPTRGLYGVDPHAGGVMSKKVINCPHRGIVTMASHYVCFECVAMVDEQYADEHPGGVKGALTEQGVMHGRKTKSPCSCGWTIGLCMSCEERLREMRREFWDRYEL